MRAFVSGGSGFLGSHLVDRLLADGHTVTVYDLKRREETERVGLTFLTGDLLDIARLKGAMSFAKHDIVFHLAANADVRFGTANPKRDLEQNLIGTSNVLEAMRSVNVKRIMFSSTSVVYGDPGMFPTPEKCPFPIQTSLYGASKIAAEGLISAYCYGFNLHATIFRFVPILGERYRHGHVFDFWQKLQADPTHIEVLGDGKQRKSYVYVNDAIDAVMLAAVKYPNKILPVAIYNVGSDDADVTVNRVLDWVCGELGVNPIRTYTGGDRGWPGDPPRILLDCEYIRSLGWQPKVSAQEAVLRTVRSFA